MTHGSAGGLADAADAVGGGTGGGGGIVYRTNANSGLLIEMLSQGLLMPIVLQCCRWRRAGMTVRGQAGWWVRRSDCGHSGSSGGLCAALV